LRLYKPLTTILDEITCIDNSPVPLVHGNIQQRTVEEQQESVGVTEPRGDTTSSLQRHERSIHSDSRQYRKQTGDPYRRTDGTSYRAYSDETTTCRADGPYSPDISKLNRDDLDKRKRPEHKTSHLLEVKPCPSEDTTCVHKSRPCSTYDNLGESSLDGGKPSPTDGRTLQSDNKETRTVNVVRILNNDIPCHTDTVYHTSDNDDAENYTSTQQWYNADRQCLADVLEFVRQISDANTQKLSRNTSTENMSLLFSNHEHYWIIEFPSKFPLVDVKVMKMKTDGDHTRASVENIRSKSKDLEWMKHQIHEAIKHLCNQCKLERKNYNYVAYV